MSAIEDRNLLKISIAKLYNTDARLVTEMGSLRVNEKEEEE
jgi:hypothetical protein